MHQNRHQPAFRPWAPPHRPTAVAAYPEPVPDWQAPLITLVICAVLGMLGAGAGVAFAAANLAPRPAASAPAFAPND